MAKKKQTPKKEAPQKEVKLVRGQPIPGYKTDLEIITKAKKAQERA